MTRTDTFVVGTLVVLFALVASLVGIPSLVPAASTTALPSALPSASLAMPETRPYREGILGHPSSVNPLTARTQADRDLVALVFSGLVRNGPDGTLVPDLAEHWSVDDTGAVWTFQLRQDARWHDGRPVTSSDVVYTIQSLQDGAYTGPAAGSWNEVSVAAGGPYSVTFHLETPLGGFLQAVTQPIAPAHLLADVPVTELADDPFGRHPIGSGPFAVRSLDDDHAVLVPATSLAAPSQDPIVSASDPNANAPSPGPPSRPVPYLTGIDFTFFDTAEALADAYRGGRLDAASGLPPAMTAALAGEPGGRALRYPGSTLTSVLLNLRPGRPEFSDPAVRTALLEAIDRDAMIEDVFASAARVASDPIPPTSPLFDAKADPELGFDPTVAAAGLKAAGWTVSADGWRPANAKDPVTVEIISPDEASNATAFAAAAAVARDWARLGLDATHIGLPPAEFVTSRLNKGDFQVAVADLAIGLDPDLYPLLASSQTVTGGSNVIGLQDPELDRRLVAARGPGTDHSRRVAYSALQSQLADGRYVLPLAFADESFVVRNTVSGPTVRQVSDPADRFWDVLTWRLAAGG